MKKVRESTIAGLFSIFCTLQYWHFDRYYSISNTICNSSQDTLTIVSNKERSQWLLAPGAEKSYLLVYHHDTHTTPAVDRTIQNLFSDTINIMIRKLNVVSTCSLEIPFDTTNYPYLSFLPTDKSECLLYSDTIFITDSLIASCHN